MRDYAGCAARGLTMKQTAREMGVSRAAVSYAARNHGLTFTRSRFRHDYAGCAAAGMTMVEAAAALGVTAAAVSYAGKRLGLTFRRSVRPKRATTPAGVRLREVLTPREIADYELLTKSHRYRRADALRAIGRGDLL